MKQHHSEHETRSPELSFLFHAIEDRGSQIYQRQGTHLH